MLSTLRLAFLSLTLIIHTTLCFALPTINTDSLTTINTYFNNLSGISCDTSGERCIAVGFNARNDHLVYSTQNSGLTWSDPKILLKAADENVEEKTYMDISCDASALNCVIAASTTVSNKPALITYVTHSAGLSWSTPQIHPLEVDNQASVNTNQDYDDNPWVSITCGGSGSHCVLVSYTPYQSYQVPMVYLSNDSGDSWNEAPPLPTALNGSTETEIYDLSCSESGLMCTAVGATSAMNFTEDQYGSYSLKPIVYVTHDGGISWENPTIFDDPNSAQLLTTVSCDRSGVHCIAIGDEFQIRNNNDEDWTNNWQTTNYSYISHDGGMSWSKPAVIQPVIGQPGDYNITRLRCSDDGLTCVAVGFLTSYQNENYTIQSLAYNTNDGGNTWNYQPLTQTPTSSVLVNLFCNNNALLCHAVGIEITNERVET